MQWSYYCNYVYRSDKHFALEAAAVNNISIASPVFDSLKWSNESYRLFERIGQTGKQVQVCFSATDEVSMLSYVCYWLTYTYM